LRDLPEHSHLHDARVEFFMMVGTQRRGRVEIGTAHIPQVQGKLAGLFHWLLENHFQHIPDFLITLDIDFWEEATDIQREALMYHEMSHCVQALDTDGELRFDRETGDPVWEIAPHDIEEFNAVVERYGAWKSDIQGFLDAARR